MILFSCEYGSRAMGMGNEDSDHDSMEVHLEPREYITGLKEWSAKHYSTAEDGKRSTHADFDTVVYGLRHWASLAAKGNPTVLTPFFVTPEQREHYGFSATRRSYLGAEVLEASHLFISKEAGHRFKGYSWSQRQAMEGLRNKKTNRPELVHKYGYDTKFAYHMIRTAMQGVELMKTGWIELPIPEDRAFLLRSIRDGAISRESVLALSTQLDGELAQAIEDSSLPERADYDGIHSLLHNCYTEGWTL